LSVVFVVGHTDVIAMHDKVLDEDAGGAKAERDGVDWVAGVVGLEVAAPLVAVLILGVGVVALQRDDAHDEGPT
jgi:hypothetical protein